MINCKNEIMDLTDSLVGVESVVNTTGEINAANHLLAHLKSFPYFQQHPDQLMTSRTVDDEV